MQFRQATLIVNGKHHALLPDQSNSFDTFYVDFRHEPAHGGWHWTVFLHPKSDLVVQRLEVQFHVPVPAGTRFFTNGYQSWSESRLQELNARLPRLRRIARSRLGYYGDEHVPDIPRKAGQLHSWTYTYFKKPAATLLAGSLSERTGFTLFLYDQATQLLTVRKDMDGMALAHSFPALDFWMAESTEKDVFDGWKAAMALPALPQAPGGLGWTSWYRHFTNITAEILLRDLENVANSPLKFNFFQIDDGWQTAVGDWFSAKPSFPKGMAVMADAIRSKGLTPGIWLAPFVAAANSELVRKNPDWLLRDAKGQPIKAGWNPMWGGWYFALDFYHKGVRDYLSGLFHMVLDKWGYDLVKLDFLFAVCLAPPPGKTRGGVMWEAMEFLRDLVGDKLLLACGAPLGACLGQADYCRIGGDIHLQWEHRLLAWLRHRERVSSVASLRSTLGRWQLNDRFFGNDPDVFILRKEEQQLSVEQQYTILVINVLLGKLVFTSDDPSGYTTEQLLELEGALDWKNSRVSSVEMVANDVYRIHFEHQGERFSAWCNLGKKPVTTSSGPVLSPFETIILHD